MSTPGDRGPATSNHGDTTQAPPIDFLELVDRLEELVGVGRRVPFSHRVMVAEGEFLGIVDELREAVPGEIKRAQRIIKERERIVGEAQEEAAKILKAARDRAEYQISQEGVLQEARQAGEDILRQAHERRKRAMGEVDVYALEQFARVEAAMREGMEIIEAAVHEMLEKLDRAKAEVTR